MGNCGSDDKKGKGAAAAAGSADPPKRKAQPQPSSSRAAPSPAAASSAAKPSHSDPERAPAHGDGQAWPWDRPREPVGGYKPKRARKRQCQGSGLSDQQADWWYSPEFLQSFKILNQLETRAYQEFKKGRVEEARRILQDAVPGSPQVAKTDHGGEPDVELERGRGGSVAAGGVDYATARPPESQEPKSAQVNSLLLRVVRTCPLFQHLSARLNEDEVVVRAMEPIRWDAGTRVFRAGEDPLDRRGFYVVTRGSVKMQGYRLSKTTGEWRIQGTTQTSQVGEGSYFGEAMVANTTSLCSVDVQTLTDVEAYWLTHESYAAVMGHTAYHRRENLKKQLKAVRLGKHGPFQSLPESQLAQVADALTECYFSPGEKIIEYGQPVNFAHIILKGSVKVVGRDDGKAIEVCSFRAGEDPIGFLEFLNPNKDSVEVAIADVVADAGTVTARIGREDFERTVGDVKDVFSGHADTSEAYGYYQQQKRRGQRRYTVGGGVLGHSSDEDC